MKAVLLHPCACPKCKRPASWVITLENGKRLMEVCAGHRSWGEQRGREVEAS